MRIDIFDASVIFDAVDNRKMSVRIVKHRSRLDGLAIDGFAADDNGIYWTQSSLATVRACLDAKKGCGTSAITIASNLAVPTGIAIDATQVYWTQKGGAAGQGKVTRMIR